MPGHHVQRALPDACQHVASGKAFERSGAIQSLSERSHVQAGIPAGGVFTGASGIETCEQAALYGGAAGEPYDPCFHVACDTFDSINLEVLDLNADAAAASTLAYAVSTQSTDLINGVKGKGNVEYKPAQDHNLATGSTRRPYGRERLSHQIHGTRRGLRANEHRQTGPHAFT